MNAYFLTYDIPDTAEIPNPSAELRPIAFRSNLSVWVVMEQDIPYDLIQRLVDAGASVDLVKFDTSETDKLLAMAVRSVTRDIKDAVASAKRSLENAVTALHESETPDKAQDAYRNACKRIATTYGERLRDLKTLTERWGISQNVPAIAPMNAVATLRVTMLQRAKAYRELVAKVEQHYGKGDAIANAARNASVGLPKGILSDYAKDAGIDTTEYDDTFPLV